MPHVREKIKTFASFGVCFGMYNCGYRIILLPNPSNVSHIFSYQKEYRLVIIMICNSYYFCLLREHHFKTNTKTKNYFN